jgi:ATP-dependent RNA circularization protein (DNA/RNA ligase family)
MLDLDLRPFPADAWPRIERDVPVTPALRRRFVSRNFMCAYNFHVLYDLGGDLYAVTGAGDACTITGRVLGATSQDTADVLAFLSEWEG